MPGEDPRIGAVLLDRVRIIRPIARGGMGKVYLGEQMTMHRQCAVKVLDVRAGVAGEQADFARRFLLEASVASKLTHPNVVTIFDYGETPDGACFIAMEYLEGRSLSDEIKLLGKLPTDRAISIATQVARALRAAHGLGVVHRDLKPGNVFLVRRGDEEDLVKVLDFGLVKQTTMEDELTHAGRIMGSPRYMAPEQAQARPVDARADIYSLGAVLYAMLTGRPPFQKATELATIMAQINEAPPPIASVAPDAVLPRGLEALIMKCLAKTPEQRFGSMEEVVAALRAISGNSAATSDSVRAPSPVVTLTGSLPMLGGTPAMGIEAVPRSRSRSWWLLAGAGAVLACAGLAVVGFTPVRAPLRAATPEPPHVAIVPQPPTPPPPSVPTATLHVETDPSGAKVKEEGDTMCEQTPCDIVYRGAVADPGYEHLLVFLKSGYRLERKIVKGTGTPVSVKLTKAR
jgi:serine/threonine-protein kinase